ncbi:MAG: peptidase M22 [Huintestinicola sp.]
MPLYLGIDTSNYTTSAAIYDSDCGEVISEKKLLPVKQGEAGLRQSDAVFHHTKQLPEIMEKLCARAGVPLSGIKAAAASVKPRNAEGSYMPCFLCGEGLGRSLCGVLGVPFYRTSHQTGHILAALYSAGRLDLAAEEFIAFHVSGGTTDCLCCSPDEEDILSITEAASSLDLKAGQLIDRTGLMLGLSFPCGAELERLAEESTENIRTKAVMKNGSCCLSGFENKAKELLGSGKKPSDVAMYIQNSIAFTVYEMSVHARAGRDIPLLYAGGVMSNKYIRGFLEKKLEGVSFAAPEFSCDNAAGVAVYAARKDISPKGRS